MSWPGQWGYLFWRFLHLSVLSYRHLEFTKEISQRWQTFFLLLCPHLPCPMCRPHCYLFWHAYQPSLEQTEVPSFPTWQSLWDALVALHNNVNERTHKLIVPSDEALVYWTEYASKVPQGYSQDFWDILLMVLYAAYHDPNKPTEQENAQVRDFLKATAHIVPFWSQTILPEAAGTADQPPLLVAEVWHQMVSEEKVWVTRDDAVLCLNNLYNRFAPTFQQVRRTYLDFLQAFQTRFQAKEHLNLVRATQVHEEDQKKMLEMQKALQQCRTTVVPSDFLFYQLTTFILLGLIMCYLVYRLWCWQQHQPLGSRISTWWSGSPRVTTSLKQEAYSTSVPPPSSGVETTSERIPPDPTLGGLDRGRYRRKRADPRMTGSR